MSRPAPRHAVLVPVKPPARGKSRLRGVAEDQRRALATAFARDTVAAARATPAVGLVMVVTDDHRLAARFADEGCAALPDGVTDDLNASLRQAAAEVVRRRPDLRPVALCADLPSLAPTDLGAALDAAPADRAAFVRDVAGSGTTMYAAPSAAFDPRFGPGSAAAHAAAGAVELTGALPTLRQDVDDAVDLGRALVLGVGPHTTTAAGHPTG
jgi:2-phospho-L-lactate/phosphoenolpyruvate guanylyltransferase